MASPPLPHVTIENTCNDHAGAGAGGGGGRETNLDHILSGHHLAESRHTGDGIETLGDTGCIIRDAAAGAEPHQNMQVTAADSLSHIPYVH